MATKKKKNKKLKIGFVSAEVAPFAKTGGLADVAAALPMYLYDAGHDVRVLMPRYGVVDTSNLEVKPLAGMQDVPVRIGALSGHYSIDVTTMPGSGLPVYLLRCPELFGGPGIYTGTGDEYLRFVLLSRAVFEMFTRMSFAPDILHANDWHTALIPLYLKTRYAWAREFSAAHSVLTIHNIGYQGVFAADIVDHLGLDGSEHLLHQEDLGHGYVNFMKTGVLYADLLTTVSPTYAKEIQSGEFGMGLESLLRQRSDSLVGVLNGVDYKEWNPETDPLIPANFSRADLGGKAVCKQTLMRELGFKRDTNVPVIGIVSRLVAQKGIDLIERVLPGLIPTRDFCLAILGSGESRFEAFFTELEQRFRERVCFYRGYNNELAHWIEAGADMFLMPSIYEPCGLNQMYSLRYGTVPIVRETGGLADSVVQVDPAAGTGTGILFRHYDETGLGWALNTALDFYENRDLWRKIVANGMAIDLSWEHQGRIYEDLYRQLVNA